MSFINGFEKTAMTNLSGIVRAFAHASVRRAAKLGRIPVQSPHAMHDLAEKFYQKKMIDAIGHGTDLADVQFIQKLYKQKIGLKDYERDLAKRYLGSLRSHLPKRERSYVSHSVVADLKKLQNLK